MICVIRISGDVKIRETTRETFRRLGLTRKYSCIVLDKPTEVELGMIKDIKDFIAFGELDAETYKKLVEVRGKKFRQSTKTLTNSSKSQIKETKNSKFEKGQKAEPLANSSKSQIKERRMVFRLHPARGGMNTKQHYSLENGNIKRGVLGNHGKKINELVEKML